MLGEATASIQKFSDGDARFAIWKLKKEPKKFKACRKEGRKKERKGEEK